MRRLPEVEAASRQRPRLPRGTASLVAAIVVAVGAGGFLGGRSSVQDRYGAGFAAGRESAFDGYDGGWGYGSLWAVTLKRGGPGITYAFDRRWPLLPGFAYRVCGRRLCATRAGRR